VPDANPPRLLSFTLDGWSVLGGPVTVSLEDGVAVLVGRNGAGKSAILEGFEAIAARAIGKANGLRPYEDGSIPCLLNVEIITPHDRRLNYEYKIVYILSEEQDINDFKLEENRLSWDDCCQYADGDGEVLWTTQQGITTFETDKGAASIILENTFSLMSKKSQHLKRLQLEIPDEMTWVYSVLREIRLVDNTICQTSRRRPSFLYLSPKELSSDSTNLVDRLALRILRMSFDELNELVMICKRIGIGDKIGVSTYFPKEELSQDSENEKTPRAVLLDKINIGLLSAGTLKILSILVELIKSSPGSTIIIEEPEMQIHPGLLEKLLNEIEAYTFEDNLILSSHSPQVVAWTDPNKISLVHRQDDRTYIRKLGEDDIHNVSLYLQEDGNLGEWIYSGILDD
jgi:predicted ATPase